MNCTDVSDLEEGEILEYDSVSSSYPGSDFGIRNWSLDSPIKKNKNGRFRFKEDKALYLSEEGKDGYINRRLREKLTLNEKQRENKSDVRLADLESISSGEYKSDENEKYSGGENEHYGFNNGEAKKRRKHSSHFYGAVEDIMSEIGETICRKSRCNYKKRKSKELKQNLDKCSNSSYDLWRREIFSSHLKSKKHKRKVSFSDSDSDLVKHRTEKRKKRKRREVSFEDVEEETAAKKIQSRDFDEMRRNLLEKLKKQKAEEQSKEELEKAMEAPLELENTEIQEIDMLIDCTNYVDNPPDVLPDSADHQKGHEEKDGEDELDLIKLRLIALASNKKRKGGDDAPTAEEPGEKSPARSREEGDLDRNELLLRAEALKTALLKKHQKRLNKLKVGKSGEMGNSSINEGRPVTEGGAHSGRENGKVDAEGWKENVEKETERETEICSIVHAALHSLDDVKKSKGSPAASASSESSKKTHTRTKNKRKKRKSLSFGNNLKENNDKRETLEEDDSTLRTQLLSDLMKKKSLKDLEKKSVLLDSVQTAANRPSPSAEPPKDAAKPTPPAVKKNPLKKVNVAKSTKPAAVAKFPKPDIQRIIVHLGSEDSSDDDCAPPQQETERKGSGVAEGTGASKEAAETIQAKYERSVEQLLSQARKKIEGEKRLTANTLSTPEAVYKHLPPSQRLEYMRLKQKIAERERLKKQKTGNSILTLSEVQTSAVESVPKQKNVPQSGNALGSDAKSPNSSSGSGPPPKNHSQPEVVTKTVGGLPATSGGQTKEANRRLVLNKTKNNSAGKSTAIAVAAPGNGLIAAALAERNLLLLPSSQALLSKLKLLLKKIKVEKMIEENYEKEISKLKNQLGLFEKKKCEQRFKIKKLWEESMKTYKAIQGITGKAKGKAVQKEKQEEAKKKEEEAANVEEGKKKEEKQEEEQEQEEGKKVSDEPETETTQNKSEKELESEEKVSENTGTTAAEGSSSVSCPMKYDSPLQVFTKVSDRSPRVDPNVMVCQFDLMGVCKDEECTYQHLRILAK